MMSRRVRQSGERIDDLVDLAGAFLTRGGAECPVLVLTGSRGCGKTAALETLRPELDQQVPYAVIDLARRGRSDRWLGRRSVQ